MPEKRSSGPISEQKTEYNQTVLEVLRALFDLYPEAQCALEYESVFQLLIAVTLSAQTTDKSVNKVTPCLFARYPDAATMTQADEIEMQQMIKQIGMYKTKSRNIIGIARTLMERFDGDVPNDYESLITLPGVGRKTANVVLSVGFGQQRIAVDTHVFRLANRIGLVAEKDVLKTELALMRAIPEAWWSMAHHALIMHGRTVCFARNPNCMGCGILASCKRVSKEADD